MDAGNRSTVSTPTQSPSQVAHRSPQKSPSRFKNAMLAVGVVLSFTAGAFFTSSVLETTTSTWRHLPAVEQVSERLRLAGVFASSVVHTVQGMPASTSGFDKSDTFTAFVKQKAGNTTSVEEYLASVRAYLLSFRSPMIRERPELYSGPATGTEQGDAPTRPQDAGPEPRRTKKIVWYNAPSFMRHTSSKKLYGRCPVNDCRLEWSRNNHSEADVVLFNRNPGAFVPRGFPGQIYVFFTMESPLVTINQYRNSPWKSAFNWTWNYRSDADIFTPVGYLKRSSSVPSLDQIREHVRNKSKPAAWISSNCYTQSKRDPYVNRLRQVIPVDHYGACGDLKCDGKIPNCRAMLNDYFYYLSLENAMCPDYVTEKYYKTFFRDTYVLAVVRGGANYSRFFPEGTFIDAESFPSPEALGRYLLALMRDEARYVDMLWRKAHFVYHEHGIVDAYCQLCYKAHHAQRFAKTYPDLYAWYHRDQCRKPRTFR